MDLYFRIQGTDPVEALRDYTERRLRFALGRFSDQIGHVRVRVQDINGPRGGVDKVCRICAEVPHFGRSLFQETIGTDIHAVIDDAAGRIGRSVAREVRREHERHLGRESLRYANGASESPGEEEPYGS